MRKINQLHASESQFVHANLPETGFIRLPQVLQLLPIGRSTWWAGIKAGRFPQPVKLGPRTTGWRSADIRKLIETLGGER
jgi:prophage regulatory protein